MKLSFFHGVFYCMFLSWHIRGCNRIRTHNFLLCKRTLTHLTKLAKWRSNCEYLPVWFIWLCVLIISHTRFRVNLNSVTPMWYNKNTRLSFRLFFFILVIMQSISNTICAICLIWCCTHWFIFKFIFLYCQVSRNTPNKIMRIVKN